MRRYVALLAALLCLAVAGCSTDSAAGGTSTTVTTSPTSAPTASPEPPTASTSTSPDEPQPPHMPALAKKKSTAGAKAFVRYYATLVNFAWRSGDTTDLRSLGEAQCDACSAAVKNIGAVSRSGGYKHGAEWQPRGLVAIHGEPPASPIVSVAVHVTHGKYRPSKHARVRTIRPTTTLLDFHLTWERQGWHIILVAVS
jgi:Family of unknown function (DUF6318)